MTVNINPFDKNIFLNKFKIVLKIGYFTCIIIQLTKKNIYLCIELHHGFQSYSRYV